MTLTELNTFLAIIETGSLVRASQVLNVTQSTVTARLKSLESELGQTLIHRNKSGATLTAAGVRLRTYADTISDLWRQARQDVALPHGPHAICNLACETDLWPHLGEGFFETLRAAQPDVVASVWLGSQAEVADWLASGKSDLAITHRPAITGFQSRIDLPADKLILVSTVANSPIRFDPGYIYVEMGAECGRQHALAYADADTAQLSFNSVDLGLRHLLNNGGSAYLPTRIAAPYLANGTLFELPGAPVFEPSCYITYNNQARAAWAWLDGCVLPLMAPETPG